mmetsp:Transcript_50754/g.114114  ORF Transcript_50754/g.114114 Transcript_50754/m.114114 type:complete len:84 (-) Transcript_50754:30-281(-)
MLLHTSRVLMPSLEQPHPVAILEPEQYACPLLRFGSPRGRKEPTAECPEKIPEAIRLRHGRTTPVRWATAPRLAEPPPVVLAQ